VPALLLDAAAQRAWLGGGGKDGGGDAERVRGLLRPCNGEDLAWREVPRAVGRLNFQGPECVRAPRRRGAEEIYFFPRRAAAAAARRRGGRRRRRRRRR
jgi:hypothetical protein